MKKLLLPLFLLFLTGCGEYGRGQATGYPIAIDDGFFYDFVWIKSSLDSSDQDCYLLNKQSNYKETIREMVKNQERGNFHYSRHFFTAQILEDCNNDVIFNVDERFKKK